MVDFLQRIFGALSSAEESQPSTDAVHAERTERQRAEQRLALVHAALHAVHEAGDFATGLRTVLECVCHTTGWTVGEAWTLAPDGTHLVLSETWSADDRAAAFSAGARATTLGPDEGLTGAAWESRQAVWSEHLSDDRVFRRREDAIEAGMQAAFAIPVVVGGESIAVLQFFSRDPAGEDEQLVALVSTMATELGSTLRLRRAEEALRHSEGTLKSLFEYAPDAIVAVNRTGRIVQANLQAEAMFGYNRDELRGRSIEVLLPDRLREQHRHHRSAFSHEPRRRPMGAGLRLLGLRKDGTEFPVDITLTPVEDPADGVVMAVVRDMTERREAQRRFRRLLESAPDAMLLIGPDERIVVVNGHAERMFGYTRQELVRQPMTLVVPPELHEAASRGLEAFFHEPRMIHLGVDGGPEIYGLRKDGRQLPVQLTISALDTEIGTLAIAVIRDLTERKEAEQQREMLYQEIRASRERLAGLSVRLLAAQESERRTIARELHDEIGQALTAVSVNLQTLLASSDAAERAEILDESITITQQTLRQVRNLSLDLRPSLLDDLGLGAALRWYLERQGQRLGFAISLDDNLGDVRYPAPIETTCFRVAQEAITNVVRHSNAQSVRVVVRRDAGELHLVVEDDGSGFDVPAARERASRGHSLGLLGMEERVVLAGGSIELVSRPGHGTRLAARFPLGTAG
jgi:PAS domain S-box-containing protein